MGLLVVSGDKIIGGTVNTAKLLTLVRTDKGMIKGKSKANQRGAAAYLLAGGDT